MLSLICKFYKHSILVLYDLDVFCFLDTMLRHHIYELVAKAFGKEAAKLLTVA
jgi:hypothetical protein